MQSQINWIKHQLETKGHITRNQALRRYISRLAVAIFVLKQRGMNIVGEDVKTKNGVDYRYTLLR